MKPKMKPRGLPFKLGQIANPNGRPPSDNPKKARLSIRATDSEWMELTNRAHDAGMSVMGYVRSMLFRNE